MVPEIWCAVDGRMQKLTYGGGCPPKSRRGPRTDP